MTDQTPIQRPMIRILTEETPMTDLRTRLAALYAKRGDDMARPTLTVGRSTIIGGKEIDRYHERMKLTFHAALARSLARYPATIKHLGGL
jgi:hypothetical protein